MQDALSQSQFNQDFVARAVAKIDECIGSPEWIRAWRTGPDHNPEWGIVVSGEAGAADKAEIRRQYLAAGWGDVFVKTSSENGERPGLTLITLYRMAQA